jgi:hypothetical protein
MDWPFKDPPDMGVYTSKDIVDDGKWIHFVSHDEEDGTWQFHSIDGAPSSENDGRMVTLRTIFELDPTVADLADLPLGSCAWRETETSPWSLHSALDE